MKLLLKKHIPEICVFILFLLGTYLRLTTLSESIWFLVGNDEPRDMLIAKHIAEYGESISRGPLAAGGFNMLLNSPVYYYFLASI